MAKPKVPNLNDFKAPSSNFRPMPPPTSIPNNTTFPNYGQINNTYRPMNNVGPETDVVKKTEPQLPENNTGRGRGGKLVSTIAFFLIIISVAYLVIAEFLVKEPVKPLNVEINIISDASFLVPEDVTDPAQLVNLLPGSPLNSHIIVSLEYDDDNRPLNPVEYFVRFRLYSVYQNNYYPNLFEKDLQVENWFDGVDGYYYYNETLEEGRVLTILNSTKLNEEIGNAFNGKTITLEFAIEVLPALRDGTISNIVTMWPTAPYLWREQWRNREF